MTASADLATVDKARRARVTGKLGEGCIIFFRLQFRTKLGVLCHRLRFALVALEPCCFCHRRADCIEIQGFGKCFLKEIAVPQSGGYADRPAL